MQCTPTPVHSFLLYSTFSFTHFGPAMQTFLEYIQTRPSNTLHGHALFLSSLLARTRPLAPFTCLQYSKLAISSRTKFLLPRCKFSIWVESCFNFNPFATTVQSAEVLSLNGNARQKYAQCVCLLYIRFPKS